jgi:hypothetical protein
MIFQYDSGAHAVLTTTLWAAGSNRAAIVGTKGRIDIDSTWYSPTTFTLSIRGGEVTRYDEPHEGHGLRHEAAEGCAVPSRWADREPDHACRRERRDHAHDGRGAPSDRARLPASAT